MKFYTIEHNSLPPDDAQYPCIIVEQDSWNDYGYYTFFVLTYYKNRRSFLHIGSVKILDITLQEPNYTYKNGQVRASKTELPGMFEQLGSKFCSLGQSIDYYEALETLTIKEKNEVVRALNDVVYNRDLYNRFKELDGFKRSLCRDSEPAKLAKEGREYRTEDGFDFTFKTKLSGADSPHEIRFKLYPKELLSHRINVIIGRNGVGKTQVISRLADLVSRTESTSKKGEFAPERPSFSRVFTISYSPFDDFTRPKASENYKSYKYCGIRGEDGRIEGLESIKSRWANTVDEIEKKLNRVPLWEELLTELYENPKKAQKVIETPQSEFSKLSSGQRVLTLVISDIVANIQTNSLLIFDEPENHLHPNMLSLLMLAIRKLLEEYDSYAIIATHSALILQEVPSDCVQIIQRDGNTPMIKPLLIECFGENLTTINEEVFEVSSTNSNWKDLLKDIWSEKRDYNEVLSLFPKGATYGTRILLKSLISAQS